MRKIQQRRGTRLAELTQRCWSLRLRGLAQVEISEQLKVSQSTVSRALRRGSLTATANAEPRIDEWRAVALARLEDALKAAWIEFGASGEKGSRGSRWLALAVEIGRQIRRLQGLEDVALPVLPVLPADQGTFRSRIVISALSDDALEALYTALGGPPDPRDPDPGATQPLRLPTAPEGIKRPTKVPVLGGKRSQPETPSRETVSGQSRVS